MPGGRPKGADGAERREARAILRDKYPDWHPLLQLARTAQDPDETPELRFQAAKEVTNYLVPKLKAVEHTGQDGGALRVVLSQADGEL